MGFLYFTFPWVELYGISVLHFPMGGVVGISVLHFPMSGVAVCEFIVQDPGVRTHWDETFICAL